MGVDGLSKYVKECRLYRVVDLQEVSNEFRSRNLGQPVIAVDGSQCAWFLYRNMDSLHGGQYKEFRQSCERFVEKFSGMGFRLSFFFDGLPVEDKMARWVKRRQEKAREISKFFTKLRAMQSKPQSYIGAVRFLPEAVVPCATVTFEHLGCDVHLATADCDTELAQFAATNKCCVGVLSNDSDFMIYGGVPCLITFDKLQMGWKVTGCRFRSDDIASHLGIGVDDLPALASLVGNDIVSKQVLQVAHRNLRGRYGQKQTIELAAELLKRSPRGDLRKMCEVAFGDVWRDGLELVQKSVCSYRFEVGAPVTAQSVSKWEAVLKHVEAKHVSCKIPGYVFTVMKCRIMRIGDVFEDLYVRRPDSPPTGLVLREMLARMYTVLMWDSGPGPFQVTEYILRERGEMCEETVEVQKRLPEGIQHPGLLELWSGAEDNRWRIFTWVISPNRDASALRTLNPQNLVVPAAALLYLFHESEILTMDEVKTFVTVAVSVKNFSTGQLSKLHLNIPDERAVYLATLFVRTVLHVLDVAGACGLSFPRPADCHLDTYFDGKLFHHIYSNSPHTSNPRDDSCDEAFNRLMNIIV